MKKTLIALVLVVLFAMCCYMEHHYTRNNCEVVEIEGTVVTVEDECGYLWSYEVEAEDDVPRVGEYVDLVMYTNLTDNNIYDDVIERVR